MTITEQHIEALKENTKALQTFCKLIQKNESNGKYATSKEALSILGLTNERDLKLLRDRGHVTKFRRDGRVFKYIKTDLLLVAEKMDRNEIIITKKK